MEQELDGEPLALGIDEEAAVLFPAGRGEEIGGLAQQRPVGPRAVALRRHVGLAEDLRRQFGPVRLQQRQFVGAGQADRREVGFLEIGGLALVGVEEEIAVGPFEVEGEADRLPRPRIA